MPHWKPTRSLERYPLNFHHAISVASPDGYPLAVCPDRATVKRLQTLFASFRAGLELYPNHPTAVAAAGREFRLKSLRRPNGWLVVCLVQPKLGELLQSALDRGKT